MQRADKRRYHYIYKITRDDDRFYIGMHSTDNLKDGYFGSGKLITRSIKKHGVERHTKEILEFYDSRKELKIRETHLVNEELLADKLCMNLKLGGEGGWDHITPEQIKYWRMLGASDGGKSSTSKRSKEMFEQLTQKAAATRKQNGNPLSFEGKTHSVESKARIGEKNKQMTGEGNSQFGKCWVTDGVKPISIKKDLLEEYLLKGFKRGRTIGV